MYSIAVVTHETLEWSGLEVTGAEATPMWAGGRREHPGAPSYEASVMGPCCCEVRDGVVDGFLWGAGGTEDPENGREWGCRAVA